MGSMWRGRGGSRVHIGEVGRLGTSRLGPYLGVDIQHAHLAGGDHTPDGVDACAIQVALVFSMFQVASRPDVGLHLPTGHKAIALAFPLRVLGPPGCVWGREGLNEHGRPCAASDTRVHVLREPRSPAGAAPLHLHCAAAFPCPMPSPSPLIPTDLRHPYGGGLQSSLLQPSAHRWGS